MDLVATIIKINNLFWEPLMLSVFIGSGIFLTIRLKFRTWKNLPLAIKMITRKNSEKGDVSPFQALMVAISACIGTGNVVAVPTAMVLGGPGALLWMFIAAIFGLATKYSESLLAIKYRITNAQGEISGGPMYVMKYGIGGNIGAFLALIFAIFTVCASFGIGNMTQANSIASGLEKSFGFNAHVVGIIMTAICLVIFLRGITTISIVSSFIIPVISLIYILATLIAIITNYQNLPAGIAEIFRMAISPSAVAGGVGGTIVANMLAAMRWGIARSVFSNEAGLGSGAIVAAAAKTSQPAEQAYVNMTAVFFDTIIVCMLTGLVIASSGVLGSINPQTGTPEIGINLVLKAFSITFGDATPLILLLVMIFFAFSTILAWEYFGEKAIEYLTGSHKVVIAYRIIFSLIIYIGATQTAELIWNFSDIANGLMGIPNLICLLWLSKEVVQESEKYQKNFIDKNKK